MLHSDFDYLFNALKAHPSLQNEGHLTEFEAFYEALRPEIQDYGSLIDAMTKLTVYFDDGHTNIELPYSEQDYCLKILGAWCGEHLVLTESIEKNAAASG